MIDPISNERLLPCPFCGWSDTRLITGGSGNHYVRCDHCLASTDDGSQERAIAAWNRRQSPAGVDIKPLEWEDADEGMCTKWRAAALGGHYELVDFGKDDPGFAVNFHWGRPLSFWFIQGEPDEWGPTGPKIFPTLEAAKAAAQADYERRILSCLVSHKPTSGDTQDDLPLTDEVQGVEPDYWAVWSVTGTHIGTWPDEADARAALAEYENRIPRMTGTIRPLYASPPKAVTVMDEWLRDTAMNVMLATEVEEAIRILTAALSSEAHNG